MYYAVCSPLLKTIILKNDSSQVYLILHICIMDVDYSFDGPSGEIAFVIALTTLLSVFSWWVMDTSVVKRWLFHRVKGEQASIVHVMGTRYIGALAMGVGGLIGYFVFVEDPSLERIGVYWNSETWHIGLLAQIVIFIGVMLAVYPSRKKKEHHRLYPTVRAKYWTPRLIGSYVFSWFFYMVCYEILFRGILFFTIYGYLGFWPAAVISTAIYMTIHMPKSYAETWGAIPPGLVMAWWTAETGTIWVAIMTHFSMSAFNFLFTMRYRINVRKDIVIVPSRNYADHNEFLSGD